jgi:hypothetical protein
VLEFVKVSAWRTPRGHVVRRTSPEFTAVESEFFARGVDEEGAVVAEQDLWDTQRLLIRTRR